MSQATVPATQGVAGPRDERTVRSSEQAGIGLEANLGSHPVGYGLRLLERHVKRQGVQVEEGGVDEAAQVGESAGRGYTIRHSGRYCHDEAYVRGVLVAAGFEPCLMLTRELRKELGRPVTGLIAVAARAR